MLRLSVFVYQYNKDAEYMHGSSVYYIEAVPVCVRIAAFLLTLKNNGQPQRIGTGHAAAAERPADAEYGKRRGDGA